MLNRIASKGVRQAYHVLAWELSAYRLHRKGVRQAKRYRGRTGLKLHIGCGGNYKEGWVNIDLGRRADITLDLRETLPFADNSCSLIYSEHFVEHIDYPKQIGLFLAECLRVLQPGGIISTVVPDSGWAFLEYAGVRQEGYFEKAKELWHPAWCETKMEHINHHARDEGLHRFSYDEETLCHVLTKSGFTNAHRREFDPSLDDPDRRLGSLCVDAAKPS